MPSSFNEQEKIINSFKENFLQIIDINFNYQDSVYKFNSLLNESKKLIDKNLSERLTLYFLKKMDNFINIKKLIIEEISKLENNLKQLDINYVIYINKLVNNLKEYTLNQRNIYKHIENKSIIKMLDKSLVSYYINNKEIFKSIKQIHKFNKNLNININNYNSCNNLMLNIHKKDNKDNNINFKLNNIHKNINDINYNTNKNNIINWNPKLKLLMNNYIKSNSLNKFKNKIYSHSKSKGVLLQNRYMTLFNGKIGDFIKKKLQNKHSSSPCLYNRNNSLNKIILDTETTMSDSKNNIDIYIISNKIIEFFNKLKIYEEANINIDKNKKNFNKDEINKLKNELEKKKIDIQNYINNIKNNDLQNIYNNTYINTEMNNLKEKNSELNKKILDMIKEKKIEENNSLNILYDNYDKLYEVYKLLNDNNINNDFDKEEYLIDKNILKSKKLNNKKINDYNNNLYQKILELIEIQKNTFKILNQNNNSNSNSLNNNNIKQTDNNYYIKEIITKIININNSLNNIGNSDFNENKNKNDNNKDNDNNIINIVTENKNLLSLSDEFETPKSSQSNKSNNISVSIMDENDKSDDNNYKKIFDLLDSNEKLIKNKKEEFNNIKKEYLSLKNIVEKVDTNLVDNDNNINCSNVSFRNCNY